MHDTDWFAQRFEDHRDRLTRIAYRMLGSASEADDAVQEAWLRLSRSDADAIENLGAWLTTVLSRVCLSMLESRRARPEVPLDADADLATAADAVDPEQEALLADAVGLAMLVVLDELGPAERIAFVLHDMFAIPFEQIAPIVGRNAAAARQLASRARRRVQHGERGGADDRLRQAELVDAFLAAARDGDFERLLAVLDPDVVLHADAGARALGAPPETRGAHDAAQFLRRARGATPALLDGEPTLVWLVDERPRVLFRFATGSDRIAAIELIGDPDRLARLDLDVAPDRW